MRRREAGTAAGTDDGFAGRLVISHVGREVGSCPLRRPSPEARAHTTHANAEPLCGQRQSLASGSFSKNSGDDSNGQ